MTEVVLGIKLKADGSGLSGEIRATKGDIDKLTGSLNKAAGGSKKVASETGKYSKKAKQAGGETRRLKNKFNETEKSSRRLSDGMVGLNKQANKLKSNVQAAIIVWGAWKGLKLADQYHTLERRIKTATKATGDYHFISSELYQITQQNAVAFESSVELFQAMSRGAKELGASNKDILKMTNLVQQLGVIGGSSGEAMKNGITQFTQSMAGGIVRAEEWNSVLENLPELGNRIADGLGMTVGQMRNAVNAGKVLSKDVFDALLKQAPEIAEEFEGIPISLDRAAQKLSTSLGFALAKLDEAAGLSSILSEALGQAASWLDTLSAPATLDDLVSQLNELENSGRGKRGYTQRSAAIRQIRQEISVLLQGLTSGNVKRRLDDVEQAIQTVRTQREQLQNELSKGDASTTRKGRRDGTGNLPSSALNAKLDEHNKELAALTKQRAVLLDRLQALQEGPVAADVVPELGTLPEGYLDSLDKLIDKLLPAEAASRSFRQQETLLQNTMAFFPDRAEQAQRALRALRDDYNGTAQRADNLQSVVDRLFPDQRRLREYKAEVKLLERAIADFPEKAALYQAALARINDEFSAGKQGANEAKSAVQDYAQTVSAEVDHIAEASQAAANRFEDAWVKALARGEGTFKAFAQAIAEDFIRMQYRMQVAQGSQGFFADLFTAAANYYTNSQYNQQGASESRGSLIPDIGQPNAGTRQAPSTGNVIPMAVARPTLTQSPKQQPTAAAGGTIVQISQQFDFSNATSQTVAELRAAADQIRAETEASIFRKINRGGSHAKMVGR